MFSWLLSYSKASFSLPLRHHFETDEGDAPHTAQLLALCQLARMCEDSCQCGSVSTVSVIPDVHGSESKGFSYSMYFI